MSDSIAICAGSFDPPTLGHIWVIEQGALLFDRLIVAVGTNADKQYKFNFNDRVEMLCSATAHLTNVDIDIFPDTFLTDFAKSKGAQYILRGIRNEADYLYEREMRYTNSDFAPAISTIFLIPPRELAQVSSSFVKKLIGPKNWREKVIRYVPKPVFDKIKTYYSNNSQ